MRQFLLLLATSLSAQTFDLGAGRSDIYLGEGLQLQALLRNVDGSPWDLPLSFSSDKPEIASVDNKGFVTSHRLGSVRLRVTTPELEGLFGSFTLRVVPYYVKVLPELSEIETGQTLQLQAIAYDVNEQPVEGVVFQWELFNSLIQAYPLATIDQSGKLSSLAAAPLYVRASLVYDGLSSRPGSFDSWSTVHVRPKKSYSPQLIYNDETSFASGPAQLRPSPGFFAANGQGRFLFTGSLNSYANAVFEGGTDSVAALAVTGTPAVFPGGVVSGFQGGAIQKNGQAIFAIRAGDNRKDGGIVQCQGRVCDYVVLDGHASIGEFLDLGFMRVTTESLNARGAFVFLALFRPPEGAARDGLFFYDRGFIRLLWDSAKPFPGRSGLRMQFVLDTQEGSNWGPLTGLGLDDQDNVAFLGQRENDPASRCLYRFPTHNPDQVKALFCMNSNVPGIGLVKAFGNTRIRPDGAIGLRFDVGNSSLLAVWKADKLTTRALLANPQTRFLSLEGSHALFFGRVSSASNQVLEGLIRWTWDAATLTLNRISTVLPDHAQLNTDASVFVVEAPFAVRQIGATATQTIFQTGQAAGNLQGLHVRGLLNGHGNAGRVRLLVGDPAAALEIADAAARPLLLLGDNLAGAGIPYLGAESILEDANGALTITNNGEIFRLNGANWTRVIALNQSIGAARVVRAKALAVNRAGQLLFECITTANDRRLYRLDASTPVELLRQGQSSGIWGGPVLNWSQTAIDESGRVMMKFEVPGGRNGYYLHAANTWTASAIEGQLTLANQLVVEASQLHSVAGKFYARFSLTAHFFNAAIAESTDGRNWTVLVKTDDQLPVGPRLAYIQDFDVNAAGEILISGYVEFSGIPILLVKRGSGLDYAHMLSQPITPGKYLIRYDSLDLRDDGSFYFSAYDASDRPWIYRLLRD